MDALLDIPLSLEQCARALVKGVIYGNILPCPKTTELLGAHIAAANHQAMLHTEHWQHMLHT